MLHATKNRCRLLRLVALASVASCLALAGAQAVAFKEASLQLGDLSLEQLREVRVWTVTREPEQLAGAAAAIYVITGEDIRRSGATTLPEALRLAPTLDVARPHAHPYAIGARGFKNGQSNKQLVLIDGRTVYSPPRKSLVHCR